MVHRGAEDLPLIFDICQPRCEIEGRGVTPVTVDDQNPLESVVSEAATDISDVFDEGVPTDSECPVEIHVVWTIAVRDRRREYRFRWDTCYGAFTDACAQDDIRINREVGSVVFVRCNGEDSDAVLFGSPLWFRTRSFQRSDISLFSP